MAFNTIVETLPAMGRFSLRCKRENTVAMSKALGFELPSTISELVRSGNVTALKLGPDEWMLTCPMDERAKIKEPLAAVYADAVHSLTEVSSREVSIRVSGPEAEELLSTSCPRNLRELTVGCGVRTVFDSVQVILTREEQNQFRLDVWRSFVPHVMGLLSVATKEFECGL
ncbi:sarcosine oxidase subunit gamma [Pseudovibrio denitrificans]|uniref:Sarcosine oxidase subunit gamma n=1 Tax=Pseudovibrio denitrificans TaxID=258256 RepID=A0A1I6XKR7_9HYPH|nr:sarcosine oxidase subunit gamma family protein [Pseudovibrio denitrificans]SFT38955.1 sarcosine oxidase subunit gamma [Pseudovibrio denitrificans]